jgi:hypothetical protein
VIMDNVNQIHGVLTVVVASGRQVDVVGTKEVVPLLARRVKMALLWSGMHFMVEFAVPRVVCLGSKDLDRERK